MNYYSNTQYTFFSIILNSEESTLELELKHLEFKTLIIYLFSPRYIFYFLRYCFSYGDNDASDGYSDHTTRPRKSSDDVSLLS